MDFVLPLFLLIVAAAFGGIVSRILRLPTIVGYILSGLVFGVILPTGVKNVAKLSEIGTILLLFSIGVELSYSRLSRFLKVSVIGASLQIILVTAILYFLLNILGFESSVALVLAAGFSLSSTAVVVKMLSDRGELDTIHGGVMFGWLLVQDLAVIPMMIVLSSGGVVLLSLAKATFVIISTVLIGKSVVPYLIHKIASTNSRELLLLSSIALALGTALGTSFFGISPALGAFLAGLVISETQEHHAVFAETRPLRDLFVALFFVSLGFLVTPSVLISKFGLILFITLSILFLKAISVFIIAAIFGFMGRTGIAISFGLAQVGEFAFLIFSAALSSKILSLEVASIGIGVTLISLIFAPILFRVTTPVWRFLKGRSSFFNSRAKKLFSDDRPVDHIIICGYGRVGKWVGKVLVDFGIPFIVIEYDREIAGKLKEGGVNVLYGDPGESEVLDLANVRSAKALVLAIPDRVAQENIITHVQTVAPQVKIISRAHQDNDWEHLKTLKVDKIVQPEFEAAVAIARSILTSMGKSKVEISSEVKSLRLSHSK